MVSALELPFVTKILVPNLRDFMVRRSSLLELLMSRIDKRVQLVCAPAGYGKTALLVKFGAELDAPPCWYSFSPEDRDVVSFIRSCVHAVRVRFPDFGAQCISLLRGTVDPDAHSIIGWFTTSLHNDLSEHLVFVFDDVHWVQGSKELEAALSLLIERAPPNVHFLLSSRTRPSLACLGKLAAQDELDSVDAAALRFSVEETAEVLAHLWGRPVALGEAGDVHKRTNGWAAAITLVAKTHRSGGVAHSVTATGEGMLFEYLTQEVFEKLEGRLKAFLLRTSILREFTVRMCDRLLESTDSETVIHEVKARSLFLEERASQEVAYKYHDLFREYLVRRFQSEHPGDYQRLNVRAASLYAELGDYDPAISHFLLAGESEKATGIVKTVAGTYFDQARWQELASWLRRLPRQALDGDPDLVLLEGKVLLRVGDANGSLEMLNRLLTGPVTYRPEIRGNALVAKSTGYRQLGETELAVKAAGEGLATLREARASAGDIAEGYKQLGVAHSVRSEFSLAKQYLETALGLVSKESLRLHSLICNDLGVVHMSLGELERAATYLDQARVGLHKLGNRGQLAEAITNLALVYYQRGEFDLAYEEVGDALQLAEEGRYPRLIATALMNRSIVERARHAYLDSASSAARALELSKQIMDQRLIAESTNALGNAYRKLGEVSKSEALLAQAVQEAENSNQRFIAACYHISLGKVHFQLRHDAIALQHLQLAEEQLKELNSLRRVAELKLYQAAIHYRSNRLADALQRLAEVGDLISRLGYDGFLLADGDDTLDVLRYGAAKRAGGDVFGRLVQRLTQTPEPSEGIDGGQDRKTKDGPFPAIRAFGLGHPRVVLGNHEVTDAEWQSRKAKELFFFLHLNRRVLSDEEIIDNVWPDVSVGLSNGALRTNIYRVRHALFYDCIQAKDFGYCINPEVSVELDSDVFSRLLDLASSPGQSDESRQSHLLEAIALYQGSFLSGINSEWCQLLRISLEMKYHSALVNLAAFHARHRNFRQAARLLETVVATDPYNEDAQYQLIASLFESGEAGTASRHLYTYARLCREEMGVDPPLRFTQFGGRLLRFEPSRS